MSLLPARIQSLTGRRVASAQALAGGCVGQVVLVTLEGGGRLVAKLGPGLEPEAWMLRYLASHSHLPLPQLVHGDDDLLLMDYVAGGDTLGDEAQRHAADLLAELHAIPWSYFGLERDTVIGGLNQPNLPSTRWLEFFRDQRLLHMGEAARQSGRLPGAVMARLEKLATRLHQWIDEPEHPGLIHGDCWGGNILARNGRVAAFIDPACYYADPEIELAFGTMFGTFGEAFFARYNERRPIRPGFFEARRDIYNLYPLLVHVRLFGGSYVAGVEQVLDRFL